MFRSIVKIQHGKKLQQQITLTFQIDVFQILFEKKKKLPVSLLGSHKTKFFKKQFHFIKIIGYKVTK